MHFDEVNEGDYRIYAGAMESHGGYVAAVVINRQRGVQPGPREAYRDTAMSGGHRFPDPMAALQFALSRAKEVVRSRSHLLGC